MADLQAFLIDDLIDVALGRVKIAVAEQDLDVLSGHFRFGEECGRRMSYQMRGKVNTNPFTVSLNRSLEIPRHYLDAFFCAE